MTGRTPSRVPWAAAARARRLAGRLLRTMRVRRQAAALLRLGLLDLEFYSAQVGRGFADATAAARHFAAVGARQGLAPHPLLEPEWPTPASALPAGGSPLFDPVTWTAAHPEAARHPAGPLGHFLATATPDQVLPVAAGHPGAAPTWGLARSTLLDVAREAASRASLLRGRRSGRWDEHAERALLARLLAVDLGAGDGTPLVTPLVTVVTPVRNRPQEVAAAIRSVQAQTLGGTGPGGSVGAGWELVVVDDGSTDSTPEVVAALAAEDPRVRLLRQQPAGVCAARNAGIAAARGRWVAFLDSDNTWVPEYLQAMIAAVQERGLQAAHSAVDLGVPGPGRYLAYEGGRTQLLVRNHIDLNSLVVETGLLRRVGGFDERMRRWVDHDLVLRLSEHSDIPLVPFVGVRYDADETSADRISLTERASWEYVALGKAWAGWPQVRARLDQRDPARISVCVVASEDWRAVLRTVESVLAPEPAGPDVEVVVVDNGRRRAVGALLAAAWLGEPRVRVVPLPRDLRFAAAANVAVARSTGAVVVLVEPGVTLAPTALATVAAALADTARVRAAQPLLLAPDSSVLAAGARFAPDSVLPLALTPGAVPEGDGRPRAAAVPTLWPGCVLALRAEELVRLEGFDPLLSGPAAAVDLLLRADAADGGSMVVVPDATAFVPPPADGGPAVGWDGEPAVGSAGEPAGGWGGEAVGAEDRQLLQERWAERLSGRTPEPGLPSSG